MSNLVKISDVEIPVVEYKDQRVVTFAMIDKLHGRPEGTAGRNMRKNKHRFTEGKHFYVVDPSENDVFRRFGIDIPNRGLTLITERGYLLLVKSFNDERAWEVQEQLVESYFLHKEKTAAELLHEQTGLLLKHDREIREQNKHIKEFRTETDRLFVQTREDIERIEEKADKALDAAVGNQDYVTIVGFASLLGLRLDRYQAQIYGKKASKLSTEHSFKINSIHDDRWGKVNTYHKDILKLAFDVE